MYKFKVGDKVVRSTGCNSEIFLSHAGKKDYYTVTGVSSSGMWLQLDCKTREGDNYPWLAAYCKLYQEPEDELPPVPDSVMYFNSVRDEGNDQHLVVELTSESDKWNPEADAHIGLMVVPRTGSERVRALGINLTPDAALQLAHDLRRMAMEIKRKDK
jgi:hypothetical protein